MGIMTGSAFAISDRLMLEPGFFEKIVVAVKAQFAVLFYQEIFVARFVSFVAAQALTVLRRLVLDLRNREKILVATETKLLRGTLQALDALKDGIAAMALAAFSFCKGTVDKIGRCNQHCMPWRCGQGQRSWALICACLRDVVRCSRILRRHSVEE